MNAKQIRALADRKQYLDALAECENSLRTGNEDHLEILRARAYVLSLMENYGAALEDWYRILETGEQQIRDYFLAANDALYAVDLTKAITWLGDVLRLGKEQNVTWYASSAHLLLAYAQMELGQYGEAIQNVNKAEAEEADCAYPIPDVGMCSVNQLRAELERRGRARS